jgi:hypothetical protein
LIAPKSTIRARLVIRLHDKNKDLLQQQLLIYITKVLGVGSISSLVAPHKK